MLALRLRQDIAAEMPLLSALQAAGGAVKGGLDVAAQGADKVKQVLLRQQDTIAVRICK